jgi:glutathione S-transferase
MKLYSSPASPFARKARILAHELGLPLEVLDVATANNEELRRINPLGKIPVLILDDGSALFDSPVICEYLNEKGSGKFFPGTSMWSTTSGRWRALMLQALGDGVCDAAVARVVEGRLPLEKQNGDMIARHLDAVTRGLDALERAAAKFAEYPTIGEVSVGCALGYLDFRLPELEWRASRPALGAWFERFGNYASVRATAPANLK